MAIKMAYQKPNQAVLTLQKDGETQQFFSDGKNLFLYLPAKKEYRQDKLPSNVPPTVPVLTQGQCFIGLVLLKPAGLSALADPTRTKRLTLGPIETVNGASARTVTRVISGRDGGTMTFYFTISLKDHLIQRFADTIKSPKALPMGDDGSAVKQIDNRETYTAIEIDPILPASTFLPPPSAKKAATDTHS